ncbi:hypothetical protein OROMI_019314 [Orobanche minor]
MSDWNMQPVLQPSLLHQWSFLNRFKGAEYLTNPIQVKVGKLSNPTENVSSQTLEKISETEKIDRLLSLLVEEATLAEKLRHPFPLTIVFVERKMRCDEVAEALVADGLNAVALHGGRTQSDREAALRDFRHGPTSILIATDVASRGLDVTGVAHTMEGYVHRIGRTWHAGSIAMNGELFKYKFDVKTTNRGEYQMSDKEFSDNCPPLLTYCTTASDDASSDEDEFVDTGESRIVKPVGVVRELGDGKKEFTITSDGLKPTSSGLHVVLNPVGISVTPLNLSSGASNASETDQSSGNSSRVGSAAPSHKGSPDCSGVVTEDENGHGSDKGYEAESETSRKVSSDKLVFGSVPLVKSKLSEVSVPEKISSQDEFGCDVSDFFGSGGDDNLPPSANDDVGVVVQTFQRMQLHGLLNEGLVGESTGLGGDVIMSSDADVGNVDEAVEEP